MNKEITNFYKKSNNLTAAVEKLNGFIIFATLVQRQCNNNSLLHQPPKLCSKIFNVIMNYKVSSGLIQERKGNRMTNQNLQCKTGNKLATFTYAMSKSSKKKNQATTANNPSDHIL